MNNPKILIGSPICQKPIVLMLFLMSIERLQLTDYEVFYHFIDDNHDPESQALLSSFQRTRNNVLIESITEEENEHYLSHNWSQDRIWKVGAYKDRIIERARLESFDYLFFVDSDLLLHPQTVTCLVETGKEIVAEVFWTKWEESAVEQPQVWVSDFYIQYEKEINEKLSQEEEYIRTFNFFNKLRNPGVYEVGGLGACTLITMSAIEKGVSFRRIKNVSFWGEDRHFCIRANALGIDLFVDTHYPAFHVFRDSQLPGGLEFIRNT